jgi:hypothetical protein
VAISLKVSTALLLDVSGGNWLPKNAFNYFILFLPPRPSFAAEKSHGHAKEFLQILSTICASAVKEVYQPMFRECNAIFMHFNNL